MPWAPSLFDERLLAASRERQVVVEGYSPFKNTDLGRPDLVVIAQRHRASPAQVVLRWHVQHQVVAIPKAASPARMAANLDVFRFELADDEMRALDGFAG